MVRSPRMSKVSLNLSSAIRNPANKLQTYYKTPSTRIFFLRSFLTLSLLVSAAIICYVNYTTLSNNERNFALSQYKSIATQALSVMLGSFTRMRMGTLIMSKDYMYTFPNITQWPTVALPGFTDKAVDVAEVSSLDNIIFATLFGPAEVPAVTDFMQEYWRSDPYYPDMSAYPGGIFGIWATNVSRLGQLDYIYKDTTGIVTNYPSKYQGLMEATIQFIFSGDIGPASLGYNGHCELLFGLPLDIMMDCVKDSANATSAQSLCAFFSNIVPLPPPSVQDPFPVTTNLQAFIFQPIILPDPAQPNGIKLVGVVSGAVNWKTLLSKAVPAYVNGLDCVITTDTVSFTYALENGEPVYKGTNDLHDSQYSGYAKTINLLEGSTISSLTSYRLTFYPRRTFFNVYTTEAPLNTTIGAVCIIIFCSCVFAMYDTAISRESTRKEVILDTKRRFVRFISHEIRTPLNTVCLGLKLLEMEMQTLLKQTGHSAQVRDAITSWIHLADDILGNGDTAVDVLNDLLNYDKIETGTMRLEFSSVDIWTLVKKTAAAFIMSAKQKSIVFQCVGDCWEEGLSVEEAEVYDQLRVVGDATRIAQILRNLLSNALKFTPENGSVTVKVAWVPNGLPYAPLEIPASQAALLDHPRAGSVKITVIDSGAGLSPLQLTQICSEGVQFNANTQQAGGGSGLGLFISKGLAEQHGGVIMVTSEGLSKGSSFRLELPLYRHEDDLTPYGSLRVKPLGGKMMPTVARRQIHYSAPSRVVPINGELDDMSVQSIEDLDDRQLSRSSDRPRRILVVDDAMSNRKMLIRILAVKGYICDEAENGQQAVDMYINLRRKGEIVDAILMDFEMPVMDGPTATKRIRDLGCNGFIVGVTGNVLPMDIDHFRAQGANMVLAKPLNVDAFESTFKNFRAFPDMDSGEILEGAPSGQLHTNEEEFTAKLHPLGGASNV